MILFFDLVSSLSVVTPAEEEPVSVAEAKAACKVTHTAEDALFAVWVQAARELVESDSGRYLMPLELRLSLNRFPTSEIQIRSTPVRAITEVSYLDGDGERVELDPDQYQADLTPEPAILTPAYGLSWPSVRIQRGSVLVDFDGGYAEPPAFAKQLILNLVAHWFLNRGDVGAVPQFMSEQYWVAIRRLKPGGYP